MHRLLVVGLAAVAGLVLSGSALAWSWPAEGDVLRPFTLGSDVYASGQHRGIDIGGREGAPVVAPASGVVSFAGSLPTYGRGVTIVTADGYAVTLVHLGSIAVAKGDTVEEGRPVGTMGWSGDAEHGVPSVHLGVRIAAQSEGYVDPTGLLPPRRTAPVAPPAPTPAPATAPAPAPASPPVASPTPGPSSPQPPPAPVAVAPPAPPPVPVPAPAAAEPESHGPDAAGAGASPAVAVSAAPASGPAVAPFRIGGAHPARTTPAATAPSGVPAPAPAIRSAPLPTRGTAEPATPAPATRNVPARLVTGAAMPAARRPPGDAGAAHAGSRTVVEPRGDVSASRNAVRDLRSVATPSDEGASPEVARIRIDAGARQAPPGIDAIASGAGTGDDRGGPAPGVVAAAVALLLLALGAAAKAARRIGADGAVLRHHADLLRQLHAAHRSRVHDRRGGRDRSSSAAARP